MNNFNSSLQVKDEFDFFITSAKVEQHHGVDEGLTLYEIPLCLVVIQDSFLSLA